MTCQEILKHLANIGSSSFSHLVPNSFQTRSKKKCTNIVNARFQWMDQQLFSRPSRVIGRIHFRGSQTCTRNSCNFCLDNSFTTPTLLVAVVHVTRIVCSVVIFSLFPFFFFFFPSTSSILKRVCIHTYASLGVGRSCIVEVTRKGEPEGRVQRKCGRTTCARCVENAERIKFHREKGGEGKGYLCFSLRPSSPPPRCFAATSKTVPVLLSDAVHNQHRGKLTEWQWRALIFIRAIFGATSQPPPSTCIAATLCPQFSP